MPVGSAGAAARGGVVGAATRAGSRAAGILVVLAMSGALLLVAPAARGQVPNGTVHFDNSALSTLEGGSVEVVIQFRGGRATVASSITFSTITLTGDTAAKRGCNKAGDFAGRTDKTVAIPAGEYLTGIVIDRIQLCDDSEVEPNEKFEIRITSITDVGGTRAVSLTQSITIVDNEPELEVSDVAVAEGVGSVDVTVS